MTDSVTDSPLRRAIRNNGSSRKFIEGLNTPFPMVNYTPSMLAEDPIVQLLLGALDEVLAPIISVLDCYDAYLDPQLAPLDFIDYMSSWLLVSQVEYWTEETRRASLASTVPRSKWRGTVISFEERINSLFGVSVLVTDSGKVIANSQFTDPDLWEESASPAVLVAVPKSSDAFVSLEMIREALQAVLPAHVALEIRVSE
ncbi:MAG: phage tail protein [Candidatus Nanopelagicales bacterium]|nr:phage tail protein [Candidatus Nanopelagicales bacterium]